MLIPLAESRGKGKARQSSRGHLGRAPAWLGKEVGTKPIEKLLEAGELGPYLLAHGLADLSADILSQIREANGARADLALPNC